MNFSKIKDQIIQWSICQAIDHSKRTVFLSVIATILMGSGIRFLVMDDDMMKMLPKNLDSRISWEEVQNEFGSTEIIFVAFGSKDSSAYNAHVLGNLWQLSENLELLESVSEVTNVSSSTKIEQYDGFMEIDDLQSSEKLTRNEIDEIKVYLMTLILIPI